jgi:DHA2 family multidrug resistance protein
MGEAQRNAADVVAALAGRINQVTADSTLLAKAELEHVVSRYALTLSFNEVFRHMAWMFIVALVMVPFCRPAPTASAPPPDAH